MCADKDESQTLAADAQERAFKNLRGAENVVGANQQERPRDIAKPYDPSKHSYYRSGRFSGGIADVPKQNRDEYGPLGPIGRVVDFDPTKETLGQASARGRAQLGTNPKDLLGAKKVSISKLPFVGVIHGAHAMMDGARKYGPYNWRSNKVVAGIYIDALVRHAMAWFDGEEVAQDSGVNHLGHAIACASILLDAQETGNLVDDRPIAGATGKVLDRLNWRIKQREEARTAQQVSETYGKSRY